MALAIAHGKAAPEHPFFLPLVFLKNASWILLLSCHWLTPFPPKRSGWRTNKTFAGDQVDEPTHDGGEGTGRRTSTIAG
jgi:hypothetical protein